MLFLIDHGLYSVCLKKENQSSRCTSDQFKHRKLVAEYNILVVNIIYWLLKICISSYNNNKDYVYVGHQYTTNLHHKMINANLYEEDNTVFFQLLFFVPS